jgi:hypothetical protein
MSERVIIISCMPPLHTRARSRHLHNTRHEAISRSSGRAAPYVGISLHALISTACSSSTKLRHTVRAAAAAAAAAYAACSSSASVSPSSAGARLLTAGDLRPAARDERLGRREELYGSVVLHVTHNTSPITRHTSHVTRHTSHVTHNTSHVTRHLLGCSTALAARAAAAGARIAARRKRCRRASQAAV